MFGHLLTKPSEVVLSAAAGYAAREHSDTIKPLHLLAALAGRGYVEADPPLARSLNTGHESIDLLPPLSTVYGIRAPSADTQRVLDAAFDLALRDGQIAIAPQHLASVALRAKIDAAEPATHDAFTWSREVRRIVGAAPLECRLFRNDYVGTEHLLLSVLRDFDNPAARFLETFYPLTISVIGVAYAVRATVGIGGRSLCAELRLTNNATRLLEAARHESLRAGHAQAGSEHLLFGLLANRECAAARALAKRVQLDNLHHDLQSAFRMR